MTFYGNWTILVSIYEPVFFPYYNMNKILKTGLVIFGFVIIFMPLGAQGVTPAEVLVLIDSNSSISRRVGNIMY